MPIRILPKELTKPALKGPGALKQRPQKAIAEGEKAKKKLKEIESKSGKMYLLGDPKDPHVTKKERTRKFEKKRANMSKEIKESLDKRRTKAMQKFQLGKRYSIGGRANLLEEMGRIDARKHPDAADRAEKRRVIGELNKGYKSGGAVLKGKKVGCQIK